MSDTPTPRTNKAFLDGHTFCKEDMMPAVAFASQLERELTTVTAQRDRLAVALQEIAEGSSCCACRGAPELASIAGEALQSLTPNAEL
jgi:hypothetical protein